MKKLTAPFFRRNLSRKKTNLAAAPTTPSQYLHQWGVMINAVLAIAQVIATGLLVYTLNAQQKALTDQVFARLDDKDADIVKAFLERPHLRPYFFDGTPPPTDADTASVKIRREIAALADLHLMFIEMFDNDYIRGLPKMEYDGEYDKLWKAYFLELFKKSPGLCERYIETREQYSKSMCERYAIFTCNCRGSATK